MAETNEDDAQALALRALVWILSEDARAQRFVGITGIEPAGLKARLTEPGVLDAAIGFLEGYQPDFIACAAALAVPPDQLLAVRKALFQ